MRSPAREARRREFGHFFVESRIPFGNQRETGPRRAKRAGENEGPHLDLGHGLIMYLIMRRTRDCHDLDLRLTINRLLGGKQGVHKQCL